MNTNHSKLSPIAKRSTTLMKKTERKKIELVALLRRTCIVQAACERLGIGRSTYYNWRAKDRIFATAADSALEFSRFFMNDVAESQLIRMVQNGNLTAIIFWLKNNHPKYTNRIIHEYDISCDKTCTEDEHDDHKNSARAIMWALTRDTRKNPEDIRRTLEKEDEEAKASEKKRALLKKYEEKEEGKEEK